MNFILQDHFREFVIIYLNDIFIFSQTFEEYVQHIKWVLIKLEKANLKLKLEKYEFAKHKIKVLRHRVNAKEIRSDLGKVETIFKQSCLTTITRVQAFLEVAGFFKKYIQNFDKITILLHHIISNKVSSC